LALLATVSLTGHRVIAVEPKSDTQQQARELLSGMRQASELLSGTRRDLTARSVPVATVPGQRDANDKSRR